MSRNIPLRMWLRPTGHMKRLSVKFVEVQAFLFRSHLLWGLETMGWHGKLPSLYTYFCVRAVMASEPKVALHPRPLAQCGIVQEWFSYSCPSMSGGSLPVSTSPLISMSPFSSMETRVVLRALPVFPSGRVNCRTYFSTAQGIFEFDDLNRTTRDVGTVLWEMYMASRHRRAQQGDLSPVRRRCLSSIPRLERFAAIFSPTKYLSFGT